MSITKVLVQSSAIFAGAVCLVLNPLSANQVQAASIALTSSAPQTVAGEDFTFSFSSVAPSNGTDGILTIRTRGDYSLNFPTFESLSWNIDGIASQTQVAPTISNLITEFNFNDVLWEESFTISGLDLLNITSDAAVSIDIDLLPDVNLSLSNAFVQATLNYESGPASIPEPKYKSGSTSIPEPTSLIGLLLGGGVFLGSNAKRKA